MASGVSSTVDGISGRVEDLRLENSRAAVCPPCTASPTACTVSNSSTSSSVEYPKDPDPIWPATSRRVSTLQPLSFPEKPRQDLSLFTDPLKDVPIYCLVCDLTFIPRENEIEVDHVEQSRSIGEQELASGRISKVCSSDLKLSTDTEQKAKDELMVTNSARSTVEHCSESECTCKSGSRGCSEEDILRKRGERVREKLHLSPKDEWLRHLLLEHKIVIHQVSDICSLKGYSEYWKSRLRSESITNVAPVIRTNTLTDDVGQSEEYYLFSDALPEDKELRQQLQRRRLEAVLEVQQAEREDLSFTHKCLFCREMFIGNRTNLFQHMLEDHGFNVGQPDNLVFVGEFLDLLQRKLDSLQCLYCERTFRDHTVLKDHMRKKQHKKIDSQNKIYDRFYVINYLELGKDWEQVQSEDDREIIERGENEWGDWEEPPSSSTHCLFCQTPSQDFQESLHHMKTCHGFDFTQVSTDQHLDFYSQVKAVNYIRKQVHLKNCVYCSESLESTVQLLRHMTCHAHFNLPPERSKWDQPQYLFPLYENDAFLFALEDS